MTSKEITKKDLLKIASSYNRDNCLKRYSRLNKPKLFSKLKEFERRGNTPTDAIFNAIRVNRTKKAQKAKTRAKQKTKRKTKRKQKK